jgi:hypothetical protein
MERYLEIISLLEGATAERSCELLEQAGIPVIRRHIEILSGNESLPGYAILVPSQYSNEAQSVIGISIAPSPSYLA